MPRLVSFNDKAQLLIQLRLLLLRHSATHESDGIAAYQFAILGVIPVSNRVFVNCHALTRFHCSSHVWLIIYSAEDRISFSPNIRQPDVFGGAIINKKCGLHAKIIGSCITAGQSSKKLANRFSSFTLSRFHFWIVGLGEIHLLASIPAKRIIRRLTTTQKKGGYPENH